MSLQTTPTYLYHIASPGSFRIPFLKECKRSEDLSQLGYVRFLKDLLLGCAVMAVARHWLVSKACGRWLAELRGSQHAIHRGGSSLLLSTDDDTSAIGGITSLRLRVRLRLRLVTTRTSLASAPPAK